MLCAFLCWNHVRVTCIYYEITCQAIESFEIDNITYFKSYCHLLNLECSERLRNRNLKYKRLPNKVYFCLHKINVYCSTIIRYNLVLKTSGLYQRGLAIWQKIMGKCEAVPYNAVHPPRTVLHNILYFCKPQYYTMYHIAITKVSWGKSLTNVILSYIP